MDRTIYLRIAYDGTEFHGWQTQPGLRTVQGVLEDAARRVVRHPVDLIGSGRTDAGVHAVGQVASLVTSSALPERKIRYAMGARLPNDLAIVEVHEVDPRFHATRSATAKQYRYRIHNVPHRPVELLTQRYVYHYWRGLDVRLMRDAARHVIGTMDFSALASSSTRRQTMVRTILRCDVERMGSEVRINVEGTGFLYNQVRNLVGTLIEIGRGRWEPARMIDILASRDRRNAGPTVPAHGLCLQWVRYPPDLLRPPGADTAAAQSSEPRRSLMAENSKLITENRRLKTDH